MNSIMMEKNTTKAANFRCFSVAAAWSTLCKLNTEVTADEKSPGCMVKTLSLKEVFPFV